MTHMHCAWLYRWGILVSAIGEIFSYCFGPLHIGIIVSAENVGKEHPLDYNKHDEQFDYDNKP